MRDARRAVHKGPVLVGTIGDGLRSDSVPHGETTQIATRLAAAAQPGHILASERTLASADRGLHREQFSRIPTAWTATAPPLRGRGLFERVAAKAGLLVEI